MTEKKFYLPGIIVPLVGLLVQILIPSMLLQGVVLAVAIVMNMRHRDTHRVTLGIAVSCLMGFAFLMTLGAMIHNLSLNFVVYQQEGLLGKVLLEYLLGISA